MLQFALLFLLAGTITAEEEVVITFEPVEDLEFAEEIETRYTPEAMYSDNVQVETAKERRQLSTQCTDDPTASFTVTEKSTGTQYTGLSCVAFFLRTGISFCAHDELKQKCCATRHRHCEHCPDTHTISGYTCDQYFQLTGARSCGDDRLRQYCCGTRRRYCETCYQDTTGLRINDMTCQEILSQKNKGQLCDHHLIKQHCCASVAHYCPCKADIPAIIFTHPEAKGGVADCANIFKVGKLADQCKHPNLWQGCCKTRQNFCSLPPETTMVGR